MDLWISRYQMLLLHSFFILACTLLHILPEVTGFEKGKAIIAVVLMGAGHGIKLVTYPPYIAAQGGNEGTEVLDKLFTYFYIYTTVATVIGIVGYSLFGEFFYLNFDIGRRYVVAYAVLAFFSMCSTCLLIFIRCCAFPYKRRKVLGLTANLLLLSICARKRKNASSEADAVNDEKYPKTNTFLDNAYPHKKRADILHVYQMFRMAKFLLIALPFYLVQSGMYTDWLELAYSKLHPCSLLICISPTTIIAVNPLLVLAFSLFHHYVTPKICEKTRSLWEKLTKLMCKRFHDDESFRQRKARNVKDGLKMMIGVAFLMLALVSKFTIKVTLDQLYPHPPSGITIFSSPSLAESVLKLKCETGALTIFERMAQKSPPAATVIYNWTLNRGGDLLLPRHLDIATYCTACDVWLEKSDEKIIANNKERIINNNETQQQYLFLRRIEPRRGVLLIWIDEEKKLHTSYLNVEASRHGPNSTRMVTKVIAAGCGLTQSTRLYFTDDSDIVQTSGRAIYGTIIRHFVIDSAYRSVMNVKMRDEKCKDANCTLVSMPLEKSLFSGTRGQILVHKTDCSPAGQWKQEIVDTPVGASLLLLLVPHVFLANAEIFLVHAALNFAYTQTPYLVKDVILIFWHFYALMGIGFHWIFGIFEHKTIDTIGGAATLLTSLLRVLLELGMIIVTALYVLRQLLKYERVASRLLSEEVNNLDEECQQYNRLTGRNNSTTSRKMNNEMRRVSDDEDGEGMEDCALALETWHSATTEEEEDVEDDEEGEEDDDDEEADEEEEDDEGEEEEDDEEEDDEEEEEEDEEDDDEEENEEERNGKETKRKGEKKI